MALLWIGTSWKMNKTLGEGLAYAETLLRALPSVNHRLQPFIAPPFTLLREVKQALSGSAVKVGAQNMHWQDAGAWTGEISPLMLADCGADFVELGHYERRRYFGETNHTVSLKTAAAVRHGIRPLVCVGETLAEREAGRAEDVLREQVSTALRGVEQGAGRRHHVRLRTHLGDRRERKPGRPELCRPAAYADKENFQRNSEHRGERSLRR
jgi:triosephosphate isomerase